MTTAIIAWLSAHEALAAGLALVLAGSLWLIAGRRVRRRPAREYRDVLSHGAGPAQRNTALIDAAPAAAIVPPPVVERLPATVIDHAVEPHAGTAAVSDDLTQIKGIGPRLNRLLGELGIDTYAQIAAWTDADIAAIDARLGAFAGRPVRDAWVEQAQLLIAGDTAAYEAKFGKL